MILFSCPTFGVQFTLVSSTIVMTVAWGVYMAFPLQLIRIFGVESALVFGLIGILIAGPTAEVLAFFLAAVLIVKELKGMGNYRLEEKQSTICIENLWEEEFMDYVTDQTANKGVSVSKHLIISVNGFHYAAKVPFIHKIVVLSHISFLPHVEPYILGTTKADNEIYTVLDLQILFGKNRRHLKGQRSQFFLYMGQPKSVLW